MGLDVVAYRNIKQCSEEHSDFKAYVIIDSWLNRISMLKDGGFYCSEENHESFIGYSYDSHSEMRNQVCQMIGKDYDWRYGDIEEGTDFEEWLIFSDNEGVIDWHTSEKLYNDFVKWKDKAEQCMDEYWFMRYKQWLQTFEFAKEKGAVVYM